MSELSSPYHRPVTPERGFIFRCNMQTGLKPHKCLLFSLQPLFVFFWMVARDGWLFGFKKETILQLPKMIGVEKQWHALCDSHCSSNPRRPPSSNTLFPLFVRSWLPSPIGFVIFGAGTPGQPTWLRLLPKGERRKEEGKKKCFNCYKNPDSLGKSVWEMCG